MGCGSRATQLCSRFAGLVLFELAANRTKAENKRTAVVLWSLGRLDQTACGTQFFHFGRLVHVSSFLHRVKHSWRQGGSFQSVYSNRRQQPGLECCEVSGAISRN